MLGDEDVVCENGISVILSSWGAEIPGNCTFSIIVNLWDDINLWETRKNCVFLGKIFGRLFVQTTPKRKHLYDVCNTRVGTYRPTFAFC